MQTEGFHLAAVGVDDRTRRLLTAVRAVVAAAARPDVQLSAAGLAEATGLTVPVVTELLTSYEYQELVKDTARARVSTIMHNAITRLETLVKSEHPAIALDAIGKLTTVYKTLNATNSGHRNARGKRTADELLQELESLDAIHRPEVTVTTRMP